MSGNVTRELLTAIVGTGSGTQATAAHQVTQNGYLDGLETLSTATNTKLDSIISAQATANNQQGQSTKLDTIGTFVGLTNTALGTTNAYLDNISTLATTDSAMLNAVADALTTHGTSALATAAHQVTQNGYLDGIEGLIGTTNTTLGTISSTLTTQGNAALATAAHQVTQNGYLDGIEGLIGTTNTTLGTISSTLTTQGNAALATAAHQVTQNGYLDGIEGLIGTTNTNISAVNTTLGNTSLAFNSATTVTKTGPVIRTITVDPDITTQARIRSHVFPWTVNGYSTTIGTSWGFIGTASDYNNSFTAGSVVSTSATDAVGSAGAHQVTIIYSYNGTIGSETATLTGTSAVNLANTKAVPVIGFYCSGAYRVSNSSPASPNVGTIKLHPSSGGAGTVVAEIPPGENVWNQGSIGYLHSTDQALGYFLVKSITVYASAACDVRIVWRDHTATVSGAVGATVPNNSKPVWSMAVGAGTFVFNTPIYFPTKSAGILYFEAKSASGTITVRHSTQVLIVDV